MLSPDSDDEGRTPLLTQRDFENLEIRFVDCTFTYSNLSAQCNASMPSSSVQPKKSTKVGFMDKLKNKAEKAKRNLGSLSKGENTYKRYVDCVYGVGDSKDLVQNHIASFKTQTRLRFFRCNFVDRELSLFERLWRRLLSLCGGPDFSFQMFEGISIVEISDETMSMDAIPCTMHRALRRLQEEVA